MQEPQQEAAEDYDQLQEDLAQARAAQKRGQSICDDLYHLQTLLEDSRSPFMHKTQPSAKSTHPTSTAHPKTNSSTNSSANTPKTTTNPSSAPAAAPRPSFRMPPDRPTPSLVTPKPSLDSSSPRPRPRSRKNSTPPTSRSPCA